MPRSLVGGFLALPEAKQVGIYFLLGDGDEAGNPLLYVGQSGGVGDRIVSHNKTKDFWNHALIAVPHANSLTQTHGLFLEWIAIRDALAAERYTLEDGNAGTQPYTPAPLQSDCVEIYETIGTLVATLSYPIFTPLADRAKSIITVEAEERFYCEASGSIGVGLCTEEGFVVLAGSMGRGEVVASMKGTLFERSRKNAFRSRCGKNGWWRIYFFKRSFVWFAERCRLCCRWPKHKWLGRVER